MNSNNKSYSIGISDYRDLQTQLNEFYESLPDNEEVISVVSISDSRLVITTKILTGKKLLLEDVRK